MPTTPNAERVRKALDLLKDGLAPYVERELRAAYRDQWENVVTSYQGRPMSSAAVQASVASLDTTALVGLMLDHWDAVFKQKLGPFERSLLHELRQARNRWAHEEAFTTDDTYRALDNAARLLGAISVGDQVTEVEREKQELMRLRYDEQARAVASAARRSTPPATQLPIQAPTAGGYRPWREIATPHPDVASGRYQQAEFAADLGQVHRGTGVDEYRDPTEFYSRTFITEGLRGLLVGALRRLGGAGGDPVVKLQTNFGGGKTHSMLALYHMVSGTPAATLPGIERILTEVGVETLPRAERAVLVGTALSPERPRSKSDGTLVRTMWGEMAWQLGGRDGYSIVADADVHGVSPGSDQLRELFELCAPCLVLIDEWVAYARNLFGVDGLPAGSFDANLTFAQAVTEAARAVPKTLVVASIPSSDIETGGDAGKTALSMLENTFARVEASWLPASAEEGFEIVRRRLFEPITEPSKAATRDAVAKAFVTLYRSQSGDFPSACAEAAYERRIRDAYPIHPELFDQLYGGWSTLERFQRTRGVLRLMAAVIHALWEGQDAGLMILPGSVPMDAREVQSELTRYLDPVWTPIIEHDVDGPTSLPLLIDREVPSLGRYSATRRVARTIYIGSAPVQNAANRGLEDRQVKLGCAQPGEVVPSFGDALRRLTDQATNLYVDGRRYWYDTQSNVNRQAADRAEQQDPYAVAEEIRKRLRDEQGHRGDFVRVYAAPSSHGDVPDEPEARLVILGPEHPHASKNASSEARQATSTMLAQRGASPRTFKNALIFLAPDRTRLAELDQAVRQFLAWQSIERDREILNLDAFNSAQAKTKREQADETVRQRIPETYCWLLVPSQPDPTGSIEWDESRLQGNDRLAVRAGRRLVNDSDLIVQYAGSVLRLTLDGPPSLWRDRDHVGVRQLRDDFATYLYLPRLKDSGVLLGAIQSGVGDLAWEAGTFAYAELFDESTGQYRGLKAGENVSVILDGSSVVVKPEAARRQLDAVLPPPPPPPPRRGVMTTMTGRRLHRRRYELAASTAPSSWTQCERPAMPGGSPTRSSLISRRWLAPTSRSPWRSPPSFRTVSPTRSSGSSPRIAAPSASATTASRRADRPTKRTACCGTRSRRHDAPPLCLCPWYPTTLGKR
jgi:predicted AAA+ superfamily ATPase